MTNREGFWHSGSILSKLPTPIPRGPWQGQQEFLKALRKLESRNSVKMDAFKGMSHCRICKCINGSKQYSYKKWIWPSGYKHYIEEHNVRPSLAFMEMVLGKEVE